MKTGVALNIFNTSFITVIQKLFKNLYLHLIFQDNTILKHIFLNIYVLKILRKKYSIYSNASKRFVFPFLFFLKRGSNASSHNEVQILSKWLILCDHLSHSPHKIFHTFASYRRIHDDVKIKEPRFNVGWWLGPSSRSILLSTISRRSISLSLSLFLAVTCVGAVIHIRHPSSMKHRQTHLNVDERKGE